MLERVSRMALLQDFYGGLLTEKQRQIIKLYYDYNLSLSEIAEEYEISRQAVHDLLRRTEKLLESYEECLGLVDKFLINRRKVQQALDLLLTLPQNGKDSETIRKITELLYGFLEIEEESK